MDTIDRIFIVEDQPDTLNQLEQLFRGAFPETQVDVATTVDEAQKLFDRSLRRSAPYDFAILDLKLPIRVGENPELDFSIGEAFRDLSPATILILITAHSSDPRVIRYLDNKERLDKDGRLFIPKNAGWSSKLIEEIRASLHERFIRGEMRELLDPGGTSSASGRGTCRALRSDRAWSNRMSALCSYISNHWEALRPRPALQKQIRETLGVAEDRGVVQVGVVVEPPAEEEEQV